MAATTAPFTTRPTLTGTVGMVSSTHWVASPAGMAMLEAGGNAADGAVVYAPDHLGHGRSAGERVRIDDVEDVVDDLDQLRRTARNEHPDLPVVLLGHSSGGWAARTSVTVSVSRSMPCWWTSRSSASRVGKCR